MAEPTSATLDHKKSRWRHAYTAEIKTGALCRARCSMLRTSCGTEASAFCCRPAQRNALQFLGSFKVWWLMSYGCCARIV